MIIISNQNSDTLHHVLVIETEFLRWNLRSSAGQRGKLPRRGRKGLVLGGGGRWSQEASIFLKDLAKARAQAAAAHSSRKGPGRLRSSVEFRLGVQSSKGFLQSFCWRDGPCQAPERTLVGWTLFGGTPGFSDVPGIFVTRSP